MTTTRITDYLGSGLASARPASLSLASTALGLYFATDTSDISAWVSGGWVPAGSVRQIVAGLGLNGGTITTNGTISIIYGTTAGSAAQGNDTRIVGAEQAANKAAAGGYASLDGTGKVPSAQLPSSVVGGLHYAGTWDASANTPTLTSGSGSTGVYYVVATAGTTTIDGISVWNIGDWLAFDGTKWDKLDGSANPVSSVAGRQGAVSLTHSDITDWTSATAGLGLWNAGTVVALGAGLVDTGGTLSTTGVGDAYIVAGYAAGTIAASQVILGHRFSANVSFPANFGATSQGPQSEGGSFTNTTGATVFNVDQCLSASDPTSGGSWTTIGTVSYGAAGHNPTFATTSGTAKAFAIGDYLRVIGPSSADATQTNVCTSLAANRT